MESERVNAIRKTLAIDPKPIEKLQRVRSSEEGLGEGGEGWFGFVWGFEPWRDLAVPAFSCFFKTT